MDPPDAATSVCAPEPHGLTALIEHLRCKTLFPACRRKPGQVRGRRVLRGAEKSQVVVFVGVRTGDYHDQIPRDAELMKPGLLMGNDASVLASRIVSLHPYPFERMEHRLPVLEESPFRRNETVSEAETDRVGFGEILRGDKAPGAWIPPWTWSGPRFGWRRRREPGPRPSRRPGILFSWKVR